MLKEENPASVYGSLWVSVGIGSNISLGHLSLGLLKPLSDMNCASTQCALGPSGVIVVANNNTIRMMPNTYKENSLGCLVQM